eukprot:TRINITY_DN215_c0_g1_i1.p1 TRINITY_DN215_c0_g1~~TRINITY_DN215_c0_g1_i1.p1  ORF type:complete len:474 (+),score=93.25 TRINITY_DN215_c0_g1_i1:114-1424(+)
MSWQDIQVNTFMAWCNEYLKDRGMHVADMSKDFRDGVKLINLLEIISSKSLGRYNKNPRVPTQKYENNGIAIEFVKSENIKIVNIGNTDITDGNLRITLGLIWTLILRYQVNRGSNNDGSAKDELLRWVQSKIPSYNITGFKKDWNDGRAINALTDALAPGSASDHSSLNPGNGTANCAKGMDAAYNALNIPKILAPDAMSNPRVDEQSVMTYISYFRNAELAGRTRENEAAALAAKCRAYGPGLVEAVAEENADFVVDTPRDGIELAIRVEGPHTETQPTVQKTVNADGTAKFKVSYLPKEPGEWKVHVTYGGVHIPGSIFHVRVLEAVSLGGEGRIRVFYSTTSSSEKGRKDVQDLQRLLEQKKIHLRPDFEPWIPVDIMEREDREAVFAKAGTRALPIVFIDDKYVGDYDTVAGLEEQGKLNALLAYNERRGH